MNKECEYNLNLNCSMENDEFAGALEPYPPIEVEVENEYYADLLSIDFTGAVFEFTAINQYVNHEIRLTQDYCNIARTILSISKSEMMHLQMLGKLIILLGSSLSYKAHYCKKKHLWTPKYIEYKKHPKDMIIADIEAEEKAIEQYRYHIKKIDDNCIKKVLERIILDEENHIVLFKEALKTL